MKPYYQNNLVTIYHGDCLELLPKMPKVDLVLTDPPYGVGGAQNTKTAVNRGYKKNDYASVVDSLELAKTCADLLSWVWNRSLKTQRMIVTPGNRAFVFYPSPNSFGVIYQPASVGLQPWGRADAQPILYYGKSPHGGTELPSFSCSHVSTKAAEKNGHPCPKPIDLWISIMNHGSLDGEVILDPFLGSGTTAVAAMMLKRKCIGIEIEEKYCEIAAKRCEQARTGLTPEEQDAGQKLLFQ